MISNDVELVFPWFSLSMLPTNCKLQWTYCWGLGCADKRLFLRESVAATIQQFWNYLYSSLFCPSKIVIQIVFIFCSLKFGILFNYLDRIEEQYKNISCSFLRFYSFFQCNNIVRIWQKRLCFRFVVYVINEITLKFCWYLYSFQYNRINFIVGFHIFEFSKKCYSNNRNTQPSIILKKVQFKFKKKRGIFDCATQCVVHTNTNRNYVLYKQSSRMKRSL